jgi:hypothetical protein
VVADAFAQGVNDRQRGYFQIHERVNGTRALCKLAARKFGKDEPLSPRRHSNRS